MIKKYNIDVFFIILFLTSVMLVGTTEVKQDMDFGIVSTAASATGTTTKDPSISSTISAGTADSGSGFKVGMSLSSNAVASPPVVATPPPVMDPVVVPPPPVVPTPPPVVVPTPPPVVPTPPPVVISPPPLVVITPPRVIVPPARNYTAICLESNINITGSNCFYDTIGEAIQTYRDAIHRYTSLGCFKDKPILQRYILLSEILGNIEGHSVANTLVLPNETRNEIEALDSNFIGSKFNSVLKELKESFKNSNPREQIFKSLWANIDDEVDALIRREKYPFYFRMNIINLFHKSRILNKLKIQFAGQEHKCMPRTYEYINDHYLVRIRDHFNTTTLGLTHCPNWPSANDVCPPVFHNDGVAFSFYGKENLVDLNGNSQKVYSGFIDNKLIYGYNLVPSASGDQVIHQLKVMDVILFILFLGNYRSTFK